VGHSMNLCRAGILTIDLFLMDYVFPSAILSDTDIWYAFVNISLG